LNFFPKLELILEVFYDFWYDFLMLAMTLEMKKIGNVLLVFTVLCATAFAQNESDFRFDGRGTITGYEGWDTVIVIPAQIGGVAVTAIGDRAFQNEGFTSITLPAGIMRIGIEAFSGNKLTAVAIPDGVSIGAAAFSGNLLTSLTIPDGVSIGAAAFSGNLLTSLIIGNGVSVYNHAFEDEAFKDNQLTSLTVGNGGSIASNTFGRNIPRNLVLGAGIHIEKNTFTLNAYYDYMCNGRKAGTYDTVTYTEKTEGGYQFIETRYGVVITRYIGNEGGRLIIPRQLGGAAVKGIDGYGPIASGASSYGAFSGRSVSRMQLPDGLLFIGDRSFSRNQLTSVTIPDSVTSIGSHAFSENQLTSVTIPDSVTSIGSEAFSSKQLTSVTIGNGVTFLPITFTGEFDQFYESQGRRAGTYTYNENTRSWSVR
jgi:hypothetical protein